ncbi:antimicrobial peptide NK-lysin-like [Solea senegalensis]|uniref:Antimicrobial peptide NK-lysin-like n=1 Tax=Solea senegalensis TaxID=28829 RepID=A0AAV6RWI5_SOLSE|nr:antimicrobial peptide NK-lysin [Solea senegalensis]KAG7509738.1 antimicrobial peptide NK-lysin-like [Solea senegalensis]
MSRRAPITEHRSRMDTRSLILACILVTCSVWSVHGRSLEISIDDEHDDGEVSVEVGKVPGLCWACKWTLNKVKKVTGANATAESVKAKLLSVCDEIGILKPLCRKFVKGHLGELVVELTTTDDVRTICVNLRACKPKEEAELVVRRERQESQTEVEIKFF